MYNLLRVQPEPDRRLPSQLRFTTGVCLVASHFAERLLNGRNNPSGPHPVLLSRIGLGHGLTSLCLRGEGAASLHHIRMPCARGGGGRSSRAAQNSPFSAIGNGSAPCVKGLLISPAAQRHSASVASTRRERLVTCSGLRKTAGSSIRTSASRNLPPSTRRRRSTTCSFSLCGVRKLSTEVLSLRPFGSITRVSPA